MKQTAVEWLFEKLCSEKLSWNKDSNGKLFIDLTTSNIFNQAKAMEKEQIIDTYGEGFTEGCRYTTGFEQTLWEDDEDYYNKNYKN
jgi:hypothetical protein